MYPPRKRGPPEGGESTIRKGKMPQERKGCPVNRENNPTSETTLNAPSLSYSLILLNTAHNCPRKENHPKDTVVQWNHLGFEIPECMGSNPGHSLSEDWASTQGNSSEMGGFSCKRSRLGGLL